MGKAQVFVTKAQVSEGTSEGGRNGCVLSYSGANPPPACLRNERNYNPWNVPQQPPPPPLPSPSQPPSLSYLSPQPSPTRGRDYRASRSISPGVVGSRNRSGGYSYKNPYDVATGSPVGVASTQQQRRPRPSPKSLNPNQKRNRDILDAVMAPIVKHCEENRGINMGMSAELVSLLKVKGRHWSGRTASISDLIAINAEVGASRRIPDPPGKVRVIKAIDAVLSTERVESMRRGRGWKGERTRSPVRAAGVRGTKVTETYKGNGHTGSDRDALISTSRMDLIRSADTLSTSPSRSSPAGGGRGGGFVFGESQSSPDCHTSLSIHTPTAGVTQNSRGHRSDVGYAQIHGGLSADEALTVRMEGCGPLSLEQQQEPPRDNPGLRKGVSHEDMLMSGNLARSAQRVTFSPKLERHRSDDTQQHLDVGSLAGSLDFEDVLGGGIREELVASAKSGLDVRRERRRKAGVVRKDEPSVDKVDRNHELSKEVTVSYKMHLEEEVKAPSLRGADVPVLKPQSRSPKSGPISHHAELPTLNWESKFTREAVVEGVTERDWMGALHRDRTVSQAAIAKAVPEDVRGEFSRSKGEREVALEVRRERSVVRKAEFEKAERIRKREEKEMEKKLRESRERLRTKTGELVKGVGR